MFHQSFRIEGWQHAEPTTPISHRHQLRPLQEIIEKSRLRPNRPQMRLETLSPKMHTNDVKSFRSMKEKMKKCYTQQIQNVKSRPLTNSQIHKDEKVAVTVDVPVNIFNKTRGANETASKIITLIEKQPSVHSKSPKYMLKHIKNAAANQPIFPNKRSQSFHILGNTQRSLEKQKKYQQKSKVKRIRRKKINSSECLVLFPKTIQIKEQKDNTLKNFYNKMIEGFRKDIITHPPSSDKDKDQNAKDNRWKKIVNKSHRRKKDLDELFKTRTEFKKGEDLEGSPERRIFLGNMKRPKVEQLSKLVTSDFDDDSLYCPWSYKEQKLAEHIRSKLLPKRV